MSDETAKTVDSYRFISSITKRMIKSWIGMERPREIPWTPLARPLSDCASEWLIHFPMTIVMRP